MNASSVFLQSAYHWKSSGKSTDRRNRKRSNLSNDHWKRSSYLIPDYHKLSEHAFKNSLAQVIPFHHHGILQWLTDAQLLGFLKRHAQIMNLIFQLQIERDYWAHVISLATPVLTWLSTGAHNVT